MLPGAFWRHTGPNCIQPTGRSTVSGSCFTFKWWESFTVGLRVLYKHQQCLSKTCAFHFLWWKQLDALVEPSGSVILYILNDRCNLASDTTRLSRLLTFLEVLSCMSGTEKEKRRLKKNESPLEGYIDQSFARFSQNIFFQLRLRGAF